MMMPKYSFTPEKTSGVSLYKDNSSVRIFFLSKRDLLAFSLLMKIECARCQAIARNVYPRCIRFSNSSSILVTKKHTKRCASFYGGAGGI